MTRPRARVSFTSLPRAQLFVIVIAGSGALLAGTVLACR